MLLHDYLDHWASRDPAGPCLTDGSRHLTWAEARERSQRVAAWMATELAPGDRLGVLSRNSLDVVALSVAASRTGVVPVPLNFRLAPAQWSSILADADAAAVVVQAEFADALAAAGAPRRGWSLGVRGSSRWPGLDDAVSACSADPPTTPVSADAPLYQMYTSGTTGTPKGAVLTQAAVTRNMEQINLVLGLHRRSALAVMPLFHAGGAVSLFAHLAAGHRMRIEADFDPGAVLRTLVDEEITVATFVPAMIQAMVAAAPDDARFPDLDTIVYGASSIAPGLLRSALGLFGCRLVQAYGMTELAAGVAMLWPEHHQRAVEGEPHLLSAAGRPLPGTQVRIVGQDGTPLPTGDVGEIAVRGPQAMAGYWGRPDATREMMRNGWVMTGDAGHLDAEGLLYVSDRVKDMYVSGGENVYPRQVEDLLHAHPAVSEAAVIGIPDERWGEVGMAFVVAAADVTEADLVEHCRGNVAGFKVPHAVVVVDELPRNAAGKVLKRVLRDRIPGPAGPASTR